MLGGRRDEHFRARWEQATDEVLEQLMVYPPGWPFSYASDLRGDSLDPVLEHLRCFYPGCASAGGRTAARAPAALQPLPSSHARPGTTPPLGVRLKGCVLLLVRAEQACPALVQVDRAGRDERRRPWPQGAALPAVCGQHDAGLLPAVQFHGVGWGKGGPVVCCVLAVVYSWVLALARPAGPHNRRLSTCMLPGSHPSLPPLHRQSLA